MNGSLKYLNIGSVLLLLVALCVMYQRLDGSKGACLQIPVHRQTKSSSEGSLVTAAYRVENVGTRRLVIVQTSACCNSVPLRLMVAPGQSTNITLETLAGTELLASFASNDPDKPFFTLTLHTKCDPTPFKSADLRPEPLEEPTRIR